MFSYKRLHTMKQEAVEYMQRVGITEGNSESEQLLLLESNYLIEQMKERNNISRNNKK
ncbi:DNA strand exchange inhibitor protein [Bacillus cereus]|uniref:DNA strand exchange inhibitor protein n=1 Tax=Bacillus cereus TaxID=1396 RepID=UPI0020CAFF0E|nr:DNA strand exchange inhibitor protein [Bacillus cereus]